MLNILESCTEYSIDLTKVTNESLSQLYNDLGDDIKYKNSIRLTGDDIEKYNIDSNAIDYDSVEFLDSILEDTLETLIGKHPHYLVFASGCRWNGNSGYKFCDNITDTVYRDYDITLLLEEQQKNCIKCRESSHDVPTGSTTIIIGISQEIYEQLEDADFNDIEKFAMSKF